MTLTATADATNAHVALFVDFSPVAGTHLAATVVRINADGSEHFVLGAEGSEPPVGPWPGGEGVFLLGEQAYLWDSSAPLDEAVTYRATSNTGAVMTAGPVTVPSNGFVWFKDPARPWANVRVDLCVTPSPEGCGTELADDVAIVSFPDETQPEDAALPYVLNRVNPVDVYGRRHGVVTGDITFTSRTLSAVTRINTLFTAGGPLFIQAPAIFGWPDRYVQPGPLKMDYVSRDQRRPWRLWTVPLVVIDQPVGLPQGVLGATWCDVMDTYPTYADLTATGFTWGEVASGEATPPPALDGYGFGPYGSGPYGD